MRALVEEVSATLGAITLLLDAWYMKGYLIVDALTRDAIVIGQATPPCMIRHHRENQDGPASTATGSPGRSSEAVCRRQALISWVTRRTRRRERIEMKAISMKATRCSLVLSKMVFNRR